MPSYIYECSRCSFEPFTEILLTRNPPWIVVHTPCQGPYNFTLQVIGTCKLPTSAEAYIVGAECAPFSINFEMFSPPSLSFP